MLAGYLKKRTVLGKSFRSDAVYHKLLYRRPILPCTADVPALTDTAGADSDLSPYGIAIVIIQYTDNGGPSQAGNIAQSNIDCSHPTG